MASLLVADERRALNRRYRETVDLGCRTGSADRHPLPKMGLPGEMLPDETRSGLGMSCRRRLRDRYEDQIWAASHRVLLERLHVAGQPDWDHAALDSASVQAKERLPGRT